MTCCLEPGLTQVIDASPIPTFVLNRQHVITHWNRALEVLSGVARAQAVGHSAAWRAFYPQERPVLADFVLDGADLSRMALLYSDTVRPSPLIDGAYEAEEFLPQLSGSDRWLYFTAAPLRDAAGHLIGVIETLQDITERKRAEAALRRSRQELEERVRQRTSELSDANEELGQYAYAVSHDLRSPLRAIRNYADFLEEDLAGALQDEQRGYFSGMRQALGHGEALVADLLALSAIGRSALSPQVTPLGEFLAELVASMALADDQCVQLAPDWPTLTLERTLLGQIFRNLMGNGLKFNRSPQKRVELDWHAGPGDACSIRVRDNGIGIAPQYFEQIFGVFQRLHTRSEFDGTGIGLAMVRKAAQHLQGSVHVAAQPDGGSVFTVILPFCAPLDRESPHDPT